MGLDLVGDGCTGVWESSRNAIVSDRSKLPPAPQGYGNRASAPTPKPTRTQASQEELYVQTTPLMCVLPRSLLTDCLW